MSTEAQWAMIVTVGILILSLAGIVTHCSNTQDRFHCIEKASTPAECK